MFIYANQIVLGIFFLYFVMISDKSSLLLNCGLQRFITDSIFIKHAIIFMAIYLFTFVLNWYTFDSLVIENLKDDPELHSERSLSALRRYFVYTIFIYILFIISTKNESKYLGFFMLSILVLVILQIYLKALNAEVYSNILKNRWVDNSLREHMKMDKSIKNKKNIDMIVNLHNLMIVIYVLVIFVLLLGFISYWRRQYRDHKREWNTLTFIFGSNKCRMKFVYYNVYEMIVCVILVPKSVPILVPILVSGAVVIRARFRRIRRCRC